MDDKAEEEIRRGQRAHLFLEDPIFQEAWGDLEVDLEHAWRESSVKDAEGREHIWRMLRAMRSVRDILNGYVDDGKLAVERILAEERERAVNGA